MEGHLYKLYLTRYWDPRTPKPFPDSKLNFCNEKNLDSGLSCPTPTFDFLTPKKAATDFVF